MSMSQPTAKLTPWAATAALLAAPIAFQAPQAFAQPADMNAPPTALKGDLHLQYPFETAAETMPYRLYIPSGWDGRSSLPLIVLLHGGGLDEDAPFVNARGELQAQAEKRGYAILAPFGYRKMGMYGSRLPLPKSQQANIKPAVDETRDRSEEDVLNTLALTQKEYPMDRRRVFLMGNSMGSIGALHLAMKFPNRWAAIAISDGPPDPSSLDYDKFRTLPVRDTHGDHDEIAPLAASRDIVANLKRHGAQAELVVVAGGTHSNSWVIDLPGTFDFFDRQGALASAR